MPNWTLITGASEGLGVEFAHIAAAEGRSLVLTARSEDKLDTLASKLRSDTVQVEVIPADLSDPDEAQRLWDAASDGRRIDMLVNNAGLGQHGDFGDGQGWARELASIHVNMVSLTALMKRAIPHMQAAGGGRILNVSSTAAFMPGPNMAVYHATKAYVLSLSEAVATELKGSGVSVTALCPGATATRFFDDADMHGIRLLTLARPMAARPVAEAGWRAASRGKRVVVPGLMNKLFAIAPRFTPRPLVAWVASKVMGKR